MATNSKGPVKSRPAPKPASISLAPISLKEELESDEPVDAPVASSFDATPPAEIESVAAEPLEPVAFVAEPALVAETEPVVVAAAVVASVAPPALFTPPPAAAGALDPSEWPLKTFDLFNENAAAVLDLALALGKAQSVSDAFELQSRFASERYSTLVKQANEFVELTRRLTLEASAPVRLSFSAFVA